MKKTPEMMEGTHKRNSDRWDARDEDGLVVKRHPNKRKKQDSKSGKK